MLTNAAMNMIYIPMAVLTAATLVIAVMRHRGKSLYPYFFFCTAMILGWQLSEILYYNALDYDLAFILRDFKLPFVALVTLGALLYILRFYGVEGYYSTPVALALGVGPVITAMLAATPHLHTYLHGGLRILETYPRHIVEQGTNQPWFWIHAAFCYAITIITAVVAFVRHWNLPRFYRRPSRLLISGIGISLTLNCLYIFGPSHFSVDFTLVGCTICNFCMFAAMRENQGLDFINRARVEVFNSLQSGMLILDRERNVQGSNSEGRRFMADCGLDAANGSFDTVLDTVASAAWKVEVSEDEEGGTDYFVEEQIYNIREKAILDNRQHVIGSFVVVLPVTENRKLIHRLEEDAGMDALTGLFNRLRMDELLLKLDNEGNYPLAVINGDMNGLKQVNDTYGHQQGDVLLRLGAESLVAVCPPSAAIGRVGGDEFLILLPGYSLERAMTLIEDIEAHMAAKGSDLFDVSMSLAAAVKENQQQNMEEVLRLADTKMYVRKNLYKTAKENRKNLRPTGAGGTAVSGDR